MGKPRKGREGVFRRNTSQILGIRGLGEEQKTEKNGGVFWRRPGPRRGCSAIAGMELINQPMNHKKLPQQKYHITHKQKLFFNYILHTE